MSLKDILVHIEGSASGHARHETAALVAAAHRSHLIGLSVTEFEAPLVLSGIAPDVFAMTHARQPAMPRIYRGQ